MKKLFIILALCAPVAIKAMQNGTPEQRLPGILKNIDEKLDAKNLSNKQDVMPFYRLIMDGREKKIALINFFNDGLGAKALAYLTHLDEKVKKNETLTKQEHKVGKALARLIEMAEDTGDFSRLPELNQRAKLHAANSFELREALGLNE